jgi:hypothetical protein
MKKLAPLFQSRKSTRAPALRRAGPLFIGGPCRSAGAWGPRIIVVAAGSNAHRRGREAPGASSGGGPHALQMGASGRGAVTLPRSTGTRQVGTSLVTGLRYPSE